MGHKPTYEEVKEKFDTRKKERERVDMCLSLRMCPECGSMLAVEIERSWGLPAYACYTCTKCSFTKRR